MWGVAAVSQLLMHLPCDPRAPLWGAIQHGGIICGRKMLTLEETQVSINRGPVKWAVRLANSPRLHTREEAPRADVEGFLRHTVLSRKAGTATTRVSAGTCAHERREGTPGTRLEGRPRGSAQGPGAGRLSRLTWGGVFRFRTP